VTAHKYIGGPRAVAATVAAGEEERSAPESAEDLDVEPAPAAEPLDLVVGSAQDALRLDRALAELLPRYSRTRLQQWIEAGAVQRNGAVPRPRDLVFAGDVLRVQPTPLPEDSADLPEPMALDIVHEAPQRDAPLDRPACRARGSTRPHARCRTGSMPIRPD